MHMPLTHAATDPAVRDQADARQLTALLEDTNPAAARREVARMCATLLERVRRKTVTRRAKTNRAHLSGTKPNAPTGSLITSTPKAGKTRRVNDPTQSGQLGVADLSEGRA
jgi:hypothetical protein